LERPLYLGQKKKKKTEKGKEIIEKRENAKVQLMWEPSFYCE
jgi:hypothetical protein